MLHVVPAGILSFPSGGYTIENAIYLDGSSDYLDKDFFVAGTEETWACSFWLKGFSINTTQYIFASRIDGSNTGYIEILSGSGNQLQMRDYDSGVGEPAYQVKTSAVLRDPTAWYHFLCVMNSSNSTSTERQRIYINGVRQEASSPTYSSQDYASAVGINSANRHYIGQDGNNVNDLYGYMAEFVFVDGSTTTTTVDSENKLTNNELGEFDSNGVWVPKSPSENITDFGTNGIHLKFDDTNLLGKSSNSTTNPTASFLGSQVFSSAAQTFTVSGATLGDAASNRTIVVAAGGGRANAGTRSISTLTVGGSTATFIARKNSGAGNVMEFWSVAKPSDTTGNIVVEFSGGNNNMEFVGIAWWRVLDAGQPISIDSNTGSSWSTQAVTTIGQTGDVALYALEDSAGVPPNITGYSWSDATERAEHLNITSSSTTHNAFVVADYTFTSSESHTETVTVGGGQGNDNSYLGITFSNNNSFSSVSMGAANQVTDTCTDDAETIGNYCTWNPLASSPNNTFSEGNLRCAMPSSGATQTVRGSFVIQSGKWHWEATLNSGSGSWIGVLQGTNSASNIINYSGDTLPGEVGVSMTYCDDGQIYNDNGGGAGGSGISSTAPATYSAGDRITVELNADDNEIQFFKNGSSQVTITSGLAPPYMPTMFRGSNPNITINFGQKTFTDTPSSGFKALNTANLPAPTVTDPSAFYQNHTYTGNGTAIGSGGLTVTLGGNSDLQPDFVWIKCRSHDSSHMLFDSVRGEEKFLQTNNNGDSDTNSETLTAFNPDGFTLGNNSSVNVSSRTYVAWCMKAGGAASSNSNGDLTSSVSAASHGGFSIGTYTGNTTSSTTKTVGHGLSRKPSWIIVKKTGTGNDQSWTVFQEDIYNAASDEYIILSQAGAKTNGASFASTSPNSTVFSAGNAATNENGSTFVFYAFAKTPGLIASGSYTGNNSPDGAYVVVDDGASGFRPAWLLLKNINDSENWVLMDSARSPYNPVDGYLSPNTDVGDGSATGLPLDFTANGFKQRNNSNMTNEDTIIYLAFAENPFGGSGVAQAKAR